MIGYLRALDDVYVKSCGFRPLDIGYGYIGPTEMRLILIVLNAALRLRPRGFDVGDAQVPRFST